MYSAKPIKPSPIQRIKIQQVSVVIKRDDLNDAEIQGNKLRKLKYNLQKAQQQGCKTLITFGGAYSNHIAATAVAAQRAGFNSVGVIRGDELADQPQSWSLTLKKAHDCGMQLHFISRSSYRQKQASAEFETLYTQLNKPYLIPEGGSNALAIKGVAELVSELAHQLDTPPSHIICPCGTGGTLAGLIKGVQQIQWKSKVWGVAVHTAGAAIETEINLWLEQASQTEWKILDQYHSGGYAKSTAELQDFARNFRTNTDIPLDRVYNCKSFFALHALIQNQHINADDTPLIIHTGGIQGGIF